MTNEKANRLINEKSPYLLQHAYNPVNWYPWGEEAFAKAKAEDKPIFLSIGYSTCHWCHVMAHESFEDKEVADLLNRNFVSIKVDKEERPDIDAVYMTVCQGMTGSGGWPMTIIMTPEQKPFFAGTYFPKEKKYHIPGVIDILEAVSREWQQNRKTLLDAADSIVRNLNQGKGQSPANGQTDKVGLAEKKLFEDAKKRFLSSFDGRYGGFGRSPKFPSPHNLMFLLRYSQFEKDTEALEMVEKTLKQMYRGGIFDHIGFGFSRYSTDEKWLVPHFEKMLYDNALLTIIYLEAYQVTKNELYHVVAAKTMDYIAREMTSEEGGFFSAQDADSEGVEGKYYVFTPEELVEKLGEKEGTEFNQFFDITEKGNFEGKSIPNLIENERYYDLPSHIQSHLEEIYTYRMGRTKLHKDDKILTSWNALMIVAYAKAFKALHEERYLLTTKKAVEFIREKMVYSDDRLHISYREGAATGTGNLDDYAFVIWALLELYEATLETSYLDQAILFAGTMISHFWDEEKGGFYLTDKTAENLIYRPKEVYDGAIPSGNSVASYVLVKLNKLTGKPEYKELSLKQLRFLSSQVSEYPTGYSFSLMALMMELFPQSFLCENGVCS